MRINSHQFQIQQNQEIFDIHFHKFLEIEQYYSNMEIAEEFGISLKNVHRLRKKLNRT